MPDYHNIPESCHVVDQQDDKISTPRNHIYFCQSLSGGVLLSQIICRANITGHEGWFCKTYQEWTDEICLSGKTIRWFAVEFKRLGFLETKTKKNLQGNPVKHYRFLPDKFELLYAEFLKTGVSPVSAQRQKKNSVGYK